MRNITLPDEDYSKIHVGECETETNAFKVNI